MDEVIEVSQKLLTALESATQGKEFDEQIVGRYIICWPVLLMIQLYAQFKVILTCLKRVFYIDNVYHF